MTNPKLKALVDAQKIYNDYTLRDDNINWWCGGCGNYPIQNALKRALALQGLERRDVMFCFDVGCSGNGSDKIEANTIHGLHGRVLPLAAGFKIGNHKMQVIAEAGDGATFSEGISHLAHAVRNDYPVLFILHDNQNYALTTGQPSALTPKCQSMSAAPEGLQIEPFHPLEVVLGLKPSFVAQTCSADIDHMTETIQNGLKHKGFAFINVLQACPTYNKFITHEWYLEHIQRLPESHDPTSMDSARKYAFSSDPFYLGQIYHNPERQNFLETVAHRDENSETLINEVAHQDISKLLAKL